MSITQALVGRKQAYVGLEREREREKEKERVERDRERERERERRGREGRKEALPSY